jgi:phage shock protein PspC (stress-responsive transcriptional regulator)
MNKIITINLGGRALQIEESAYQILRQYFQKLEEHFEKTDNYEEIIEDIEARFADMLFEKLGTTKVSINEQDVKEAVDQMGDPSAIQEEAEQTASAEEEYARHRSHGGRKRLFRDEDEGILGGVCAGLASYFGIDVTIVRIIWLLFLIIGGFGVVLYILLWLVIPKAVTRADKLQMKGEVPNVENIKRSFQEEADRVSKKVGQSGIGEVVQNILSALLKFIKVAFKAIGTLGIIAIAIGVLAICVMLVFGIGLFDPDSFSVGSYNYLNEGWQTLTFMALFAVALVLPLVLLALKLSQWIFGLSISKMVYISGIGAWIISIVGIVTLSQHGYSMVEEMEEVDEKMIIDPADTLIVALDNTEKDYYRYQPDVRVKRSLTGERTLVIHKQAAGKDEEAARKTAREIETRVQVKSGRLILHGFKPSKEHRDLKQSINYTLYLPEGDYVVMDKTLGGIEYGSDIKDDVNYYDLLGQTLLMTRLGLTCVSCQASERLASDYSDADYISLESFTGLDIEDALDIEIRNSEKCRIGFKSKDVEESVDYEVRNNRLYIGFSSKEAYQRLKSLLTDGERAQVIVELPLLDNLDISGAVKCVIDPFEGRDLRIDATGANDLMLLGLTYEEVRLEVSGAAKVEMKGSVNNLDIDQSGASVIEAGELVVENSNLDLSGASYCRIHVTDRLVADLSGTSKLTYSGRPNDKSIEKSGLVKVEKI